MLTARIGLVCMAVCGEAYSMCNAACNAACLKALLDQKYATPPTILTVLNANSRKQLAIFVVKNNCGNFIINNDAYILGLFELYLGIGLTINM